MKKSVQKTAARRKGVIAAKTELAPKALQSQVAAIAKRRGWTASHWVERSEERWKEQDAIFAEQKRWEREMESYDVIDGFYSTCGCMPSVEVLALTDNDGLVHYRGENAEPVTLAEGLSILADMNTAARMFPIEPWANGTSYTAQVRWCRLLANALEKGGAR